MPNHAPNGGVAETAVALSAGAEVVSPSSVSDSEETRDQEKDAARKAEKQARKAAREQEKIARAEAKAAEKLRKKANAKTEAAVAEKAAKARSETDATESKPKSRKLRFESTMDREEVASYLAVREGLGEGRFPAHLPRSRVGRRNVTGTRHRRRLIQPTLCPVRRRAHFAPGAPRLAPARAG